MKQMFYFLGKLWQHNSAALLKQQRFLWIAMSFLFFTSSSPLLLAQQDSLQLGLRELGERSVSDYEEQNNSGIANKALNDLNLNAAQLKAIVTAAGIADFKVFDYTAYSLMGRFKEPQKWNDWSFNTMDSLIRNGTAPKYGYQHYLLIGKEINPSDGKVKFRVKLSLPNTLFAKGNNADRVSNDEEIKKIEEMTIKKMDFNGDIGEIPNRVIEGIIYLKGAIWKLSTKETYYFTPVGAPIFITEIDQMLYNQKKLPNGAIYGWVDKEGNRYEIDYDESSKLFKGYLQIFPPTTSPTYYPIYEINYPKKNVRVQYVEYIDQCAMNFKTMDYIILKDLQIPIQGLVSTISDVTVNTAFGNSINWVIGGDNKIIYCNDFTLKLKEYYIHLMQKTTSIEDRAALLEFCKQLEPYFFEHNYLFSSKNENFKDQFVLADLSSNKIKYNVFGAQSDILAFATLIQNCFLPRNTSDWNKLIFENAISKINSFKKNYDNFKEKYNDINFTTTFQACANVNTCPSEANSILNYIIDKFSFTNDLKNVSIYGFEDLNWQGRIYMLDRLLHMGIGINNYPIAINTIISTSVDKNSRLNIVKWFNTVTRDRLNNFIKIMEKDVQILYQAATNLSSFYIENDERYSNIEKALEKNQNLSFENKRIIPFNFSHEEISANIEADKTFNINIITHKITKPIVVPASFGQNNTPITESKTANIKCLMNSPIVIPGNSAEEFAAINNYFNDKSVIVPAFMLYAFQKKKEGEIKVIYENLGYDILFKGLAIYGLVQSFGTLTAAEGLAAHLWAYANITIDVGGLALSVLPEGTFSPAVEKTYNIICGAMIGKALTNWLNSPKALTELTNLKNEADDVINRLEGKPGLSAIEQKQLAAAKNVKKVADNCINGACFTPNTSITYFDNTQHPIKDVKIGDLLLSNTKVTKGYAATLAQNRNIAYLALGSEVNPDPYTSADQKALDKLDYSSIEMQKVSLAMTKGNGTTSEIQLLRPTTWLETQGIAAIGKSAYLHLPEMGLEGFATVTDLAHFRVTKCPSPSLPEGEGETNGKVLSFGEDLGEVFGSGLVTGVFKHIANGVYHLKYDNGDTLGVTGTHPLYSLDRQQFIPTEDIKVGEHLLSKAGIITVVAKRYDPTPQEVYNLEVGQWHNFLVGKSAVVVHNSYAIPKPQSYLYEDWSGKGVHINICDINNPSRVITEAKLVLEDGKLAWVRWGDKTTDPKLIKAANKEINTLLDNKSIMKKSSQNMDELIRDHEWHITKGTQAQAEKAGRQLPIIRQQKVLIEDLIKTNGW